jgi:hypothetical protein
MHADVSTSDQHSSSLFMLKAKQNLLRKDKKGPDRSCSNDMTQLLHHDSTSNSQHPTCFTRDSKWAPWRTERTSPRRSLLTERSAALRYARGRNINYDDEQCDLPRTASQLRNSHCVQMSWQCHHNRATNVDIRVRLWAKHDFHCPAFHETRIYCRNLYTQLLSWILSKSVEKCSKLTHDFMCGVFW